VLDVKDFCHSVFRVTRALLRLHGLITSRPERVPLLLYGLLIESQNTLLDCVHHLVNPFPRNCLIQMA